MWAHLATLQQAKNEPTPPLSKGIWLIRAQWSEGGIDDKRRMRETRRREARRREMKRMEMRRRARGINNEGGNRGGGKDDGPTTANPPNNDDWRTNATKSHPTMITAGLTQVNSAQ
jgi:hypothetical protein